MLNFLIIDNFSYSSARTNRIFFDVTFNLSNLEGFFLIFLRNFFFKVFLRNVYLDVSFRTNLSLMLLKYRSFVLLKLARENYVIPAVSSCRLVQSLSSLKQFKPLVNYFTLRSNFNFLLYFKKRLISSQASYNLLSGDNLLVESKTLFSRSPNFFGLTNIDIDFNKGCSWLYSRLIYNNFLQANSLPIPRNLPKSYFITRDVNKSFFKTFFLYYPSKGKVFGRFLCSNLGSNFSCTIEKRAKRNVVKFFSSELEFLSFEKLGQVFRKNKLTHSDLIRDNNFYKRLLGLRKLLKKLFLKKIKFNNFNVKHRVLRRFFVYFRKEAVNLYNSGVGGKPLSLNPKLTDRFKPTNMEFKRSSFLFENVFSREYYANLLSRLELKTIKNIRKLRNTNKSLYKKYLFSGVDTYFKLVFEFFFNKYSTELTTLRERNFFYENFSATLRKNLRSYLNDRREITAGRFSSIAIVQKKLFF